MDVRRAAIIALAGFAAVHVTACSETASKQPDTAANTPGIAARAHQHLGELEGSPPLPER